MPKHSIRTNYEGQMKWSKFIRSPINTKTKDKKYCSKSTRVCSYSKLFQFLILTNKHVTVNYLQISISTPPSSLIKELINILVKR